MKIKKITLVACCAQKLSSPAPARDLYRSPLFKKSAAYADMLGNEWFVLSGLYGLIASNNTVAPYDYSMRGAGNRADWNKEVLAEIERMVAFWGADRVEITVLAGVGYLGWSDSVPRGCVVITPLDKMQVGQRLQWLNTQLSTGVPQ